MREHVGSECFDHLWVWGKDGEAAVRQTLAGLLIRASSNLDISYVPADAKETDSNLMPRRHPSHAENGVYWLPHNAYRYATVANFLYTPPESETYSFLTNFSLLSSMPIANYTFKTPGMASMAQVRAFDKLIKKYLDELPPLIDYPGINKLPVPEWAIYVALAIAVIIFCCAAARCKKYCKNLKLRKKKEKKLSSVQETVVHFAANSSDSSSDGECVTLLGRTSRGIQTIYQAVRDSMPDYAYWAFWPFYWWFRKNERYYREQGYLEQTPTQVPDAYYRRTPPQLSIVAAKPENLPPRLPPLPGPRSDTAADQRSPSPTPRRRHRSNSASRKGQPSRPRSRSIEMVRIETAPPPRASKPPAKPSRTHPHVSSTDTSTTTVNIEAPPQEPTPKATHPKGGRGLKRMSELTRIDQPDVHRAWVEHKLAHSSPVISGRAPGQPYTLEEWSDQLEKGGGKDEVNSLDPPLPNHLSEGGGKDEVNSLDSTLPSSTLPTLEELASTPSTSKEFTAEGTPANFAEPQPNKPKKKFAKLRLRAKIRSKELARNRTGRKPLVARGGLNFMQAGQLLSYQVPIPPDLDDEECTEHYVQDYLVAPEGKIHFEGYQNRYLASGEAFQEETFAQTNTYVSAGLGLAAKRTVRQVKALIDTGADISVLSREAARYYEITRFEEGEQPEIRQADGSALVWEGYVEVHLFLCGQLYPHLWYVPAENSCSEDYGAIIGTDLLAAMGMLIVDFDRHQISIKNRHTKANYIFRTADRRCIIEPKAPEENGRQDLPPWPPQSPRRGNRPPPGGPPDTPRPPPDTPRPRGGGRSYADPPFSPAAGSGDSPNATGRLPDMAQDDPLPPTDDDTDPTPGPSNAAPAPAPSRSSSTRAEPAQSTQPRRPRRRTGTHPPQARTPPPVPHPSQVETPPMIQQPAPQQPVPSNWPRNRPRNRYSNPDRYPRPCSHSSTGPYRTRRPTDPRHTPIPASHRSEDNHHHGPAGRPTTPAHGPAGRPTTPTHGPADRSTTHATATHGPADRSTTATHGLAGRRATATTGPNDHYATSAQHPVGH
jgi:hypothetical protein